MYPKLPLNLKAYSKKTNSKTLIPNGGSISARTLKDNTQANA